MYRTETVTQCSTVIMLDMSYSMMIGGRFQAGRKVALALDSLIRSQFPKDNLYVVAFSYFVLTLQPRDAAGQLLDRVRRRARTSRRRCARRACCWPSTRAAPSRSS